MLEDMGMMGEVLDHRWRSVFISSEARRTMGVSADEARTLLGLSVIERATDERFADIVRLTEDSGTAWARHNVPIMRRYVQPGDPDFDEVFGDVAAYAARVAPVEEPPRAWCDTVAF